MNILTLISNYQRKDMLQNLIKECDDNNIDYYIIDDCSDYKLDFIPKDKYKVNEYNRNKKEYYKTFNELMDYALNSKYDYFIFSPNDFSQYDFDRINTIIDDYNTKPFIFNLINDGRTKCWTNKNMLKINDDLNKIYWTDCGLVTNRITLELLKDLHVPHHWFKRPNMSSGVGYELTKRINMHSIPTFMPTKSLAFHGDHPSMMHQTERLKNPLISK
jgi:hypothetical protein